MAIARKHQIDPSKPGYYHLMNHCVRDAFALGKGPGEKLYYERKAFVEDVLYRLCRCFMMRLLEFTLMDNHYHMVVHFNPKRIGQYSDEELVELVFRLDVKSPNRPDWPEQVKKKWKEDLYADKQKLRKWRKNLCDPSEFMAYFNYAVALECNRQDGLSGHFWKERFKAVRLEDAGAVLKRAIYNALNPLRAGMCVDLAGNPHSGISIRLLSVADEAVAEQKVGAAALRQIKRMAQVLCPLEEWFKESGWKASPQVTLEEYVRICEAAGRLRREGKRGYLKPEEEGILKRLGLKAEVLHDLEKRLKQYRYHEGGPERMKRSAEEFGRKRLWGMSQAVKDYLETGETCGN